MRRECSGRIAVFSDIARIRRSLKMERGGAKDGGEGGGEGIGGG